MRLLKIENIDGQSKKSEFISTDKITAVRFVQEQPSLMMLYIEAVNGRIYKWIFTDGKFKAHQDAVIDMLANIEKYGMVADFGRLIEHEGGIRC